jgi:LmbE family N-acetylglucosaminyl deacetylase
MEITFGKSTCDVFVPDGADLKGALRRTTHLGIGAHPDDLEFMAIHGILQCFGRADAGFTGVTCTDGAGSSRVGVYADCTDDDMKKVRRQEQRAAAMIGRYAAMLQLDYTSAEAKDPAESRLEEDLLAILGAARPKAVYTHNPADKHATHVGVVVKAIRALRRLPPEQRPERVYGCESWRGLDWMADSRKVKLECGGRDHLAASLLGVYDSQIAGGKRYDAATLGRWRANATMLESHAADKSDAMVYAMDLTPLVQDESPDIVEYVLGFVEELKGQVKQGLEKMAAGRRR